MDSKIGEYILMTCVTLQSTNFPQPDKLESSGIEAVLTTTMYAIIGAVALQRGGEVAAEVAREKVLKPLGVL